MGGLCKNRWEADRWYVGLVGGRRWIWWKVRGWSPKQIGDGR